MLESLLHEDFGPLLSARRRMDERIIEFCNSLTGKRLEGVFTYTSVTIPEPVTQKLAPALAHFFNQQTHHRGHVHAILTQITGKAPSLDLIYYQRGARQQAD